MSSGPPSGLRRTVTSKGCAAFAIVGLANVFWAISGGGVPSSSAVLLYVLVPAVFVMPFALYALHRFFPHWWYRRWQCRGCGYDLRGTPDGSPCPECGRSKPRPDAGA